MLRPTAFFLALTALLASPAASDPAFELRRIVATGDASPDGNGSWNFPYWHPVLAEDGRVAVTANLGGSAGGLADDEALLYGDEDGLVVLAREGDPAPDGVGVFGSVFPNVPVFNEPSLGDTGEVLTGALFLGGPAVGIVAAGAGGVDLLLRDGDAVDPATSLVALRPGFLGANSAGSCGLALEASVDGASTFGVWRAAPATPILQVGDPSPDGVGAVVDVHVGWVALNAHGDACFVAEVEPAVPGADPDGVLVLDRARGGTGATTVLAREGAAAPGGGAFSDIPVFAGSTGPVLNAAGQVLAALRVEGVETLLRAEPSGALTVVSRAGDPSPDGDGELLSYLLANLADSGELAFLTAFDFGTGQGTDGDFGIVRGGASPLAVVARTGRALPGGGATFGTSFSLPHVNAHGTLAFIANTAQDPFAYGLFWQRAGGALVELLRQGDPLDGRVVDFVSLPSNPDPGGHAPLNESDELVFAVYFTDGASGIYKAVPCQDGAPPGVCNALTADARAASLAAGASVALELDAGVAQAARPYWILGSASGTAPGLPLGPGLTLPLNLDPYFQFTLSNPNALIAGALGLLDADGRASATFVVPAGADPSLAGLTLRHAFAVFDLAAVATFASNALPVSFLP